MSRYRVCIVAPGVFEYGGVSSVVRNVLAGLVDRGVDCALVTDATSERTCHVPDAVNVETVERPSVPFPLDVLGFSLRARSKFEDVAAESDVVHAHGHHIALPSLARSANRLTTPLAVTAHGTYLNELSSFDAYPDFAGDWKYRTGVRSDHTILKAGVRRADRVHAVSANTAREVQRLGVDPDRIEYVPNGIDLDAFDRDRTDSPNPRERYDLSDGVVVSVGSLVPRKGVHTLVEAARRFRDRDVSIVHVGAGGPDGYAAYLEDRVRALDVDDTVVFTGRVSRDELLGWLDASSVFALPSYAEGFPISLLEAAASATTCVATDVGGARDLLGDDGFYPEAGDPSSLADALEAALADSRGPAVRERVRDGFTWDAVVDELLDFYRSCA